MARFIIPLLIFSTIFFLIEFYAFQALKTVTKSKIIKWVWIILAIAIYLNLFYTLFTTPRSAGQTKAFQFAAGFLITFLIPKLVLLIIMFGEDVVRVIQKLITWVGPGETKPLAGRRAFISKIALVL